MDDIISLTDDESNQSFKNSNSSDEIIVLDDDDEEEDDDKYNDRTRSDTYNNHNNVSNDNLNFNDLDNDSNYNDDDETDVNNNILRKRKPNSLNNSKAKKEPSPILITIEDDDTELPPISEILSQNRFNNVNEDTFMSLNSHSTTSPQITNPVTPTLINNTDISGTHESTFSTNQNDSIIKTPSINTSSPNITAKRMYIETPNAVNSTSTTQKSTASNTPIASNNSTSPDYGYLDNDFDVHMINQEYCANALKTLKNQDFSVASSASATSVTSSSSATSLLQRFTMQDKKRLLPKYNSVKNFNPKLCYSSSFINDSVAPAQQHQQHRHTQQQKQQQAQFQSPSPKISKLDFLKKTISSNFQSFNSLSPLSNIKISNYSISSSIDDDYFYAKKYDDHKLSLQPKVLLNRLSNKDILLYKKGLKNNFGIDITNRNFDLLNESLSKSSNQSNKSKRKLGRLSSSEEDSNDFRISSKRKKLATFDESSNESNSKSSNKYSSFTEISNFDDNSSTGFFKEQQRLAEKKIVMKIVREQNNTYNASVSCSEEEKLPEKTVAPVHHIPASSLSNSNIVISVKDKIKPHLPTIVSVSTASVAATVVTTSITAPSTTKTTTVTSITAFPTTTITTSTITAAVSTTSTITSTSTIEPVVKPKVVQSRGKNLNLISKTQPLPSNDLTAQLKTKASETEEIKKRKTIFLAQPVVSTSTSTSTTKTTNVLKVTTPVPTPALSVPSNKSTVTSDTSLTTKTVFSNETEKPKTQFKIPRIVREPTVTNTSSSFSTTTTIFNTATAISSSLKTTTSSLKSTIPSAITDRKVTTSTTTKTSLVARKAKTKSTKQKKPIKKVPNKKVERPVPSTKIATRQNTQQKQQLENEQKQLQTKNQSNIIELKAQIGLEAIFVKIYRSLDDIHIDINTFNLINSGAYYNQSEDYGLSYLSLNDNEKIHLLKLMRRRQYVNHYELFANEFNKKFENNNNNSIDFYNNITIIPSLDEEENLIVNELRKYNFCETMAFFKRFREMLTSPYRQIDVFDDEQFNGWNVKVTFENDGLITSTDTSPESCCLYVLHRRTSDYHSSWIRKSLHIHQSIDDDEDETEEGELKDDDENEKNNNLKPTTSLSQNDLFELSEKRKLVDDEDFWDEVHIRKVYKNSLVRPSAFELIMNKTKNNYASRETDRVTLDSIDKQNKRPRFKLNYLHQQPVRGSQAKVEFYKPAGIPNSVEFERRFNNYSANYNIDVSFNDVFFDVNDCYYDNYNYNNDDLMLNIDTSNHNYM